jgi:hypothetical protein
MKGRGRSYRIQKSVKRALLPKDAEIEAAAVRILVFGSVVGRKRLEDNSSCSGSGREASR